MKEIDPEEREMTEAELEELFAKNPQYIRIGSDAKNKKCLKCQENCKQSEKVTIVSCPHYNPK